MKTLYLSIALWLIFSVAYADQPDWCIQVIRCSVRANAEATYDKVGSYENKRIEKSNGSYTVSIGHYKSKADAYVSLHQVRRQFHDAFLRLCGEDGYQIIRETKPSRKAKTVASKVLPSPPEKAAAKTASPGFVTGKGSSTGTDASLNATEKNITCPDISSKADEVTKEKSSAASEVSEASISEKKHETAETTKQEKVQLLKAGMQYYYDKQYQEAISHLTRYLSLWPKSEHCSAVLFIIGKSFEEMGHPLSALNIFGRVLKQYPESPEAFTGMIAMADISVRHPSLKYPVFMEGAQYVRDPVLAYDKALRHKIPAQMAEAVRFKKGRALLKRDHHQMSYDCLSSLIYDAPQTVYRNEILDMMKTNAVTLINHYHQAGDHIAAIDLFFEATDKNLIGYGDTDTILQSCLSFAQMGMYDISVNILKRLRPQSRNEAFLSKFNNTAKEIERLRLNHYASSNQVKEKWKLYESGKAYLKADDLPMAQKKLSELKNASDEPFWSKITDYALQENHWHKKYHNYLKKKN
ncbi:MAG: tetratricopeptide repeat protein [Deltaproteobacteria bacterium]|nr:tetratricopeptide repeat protein [Deltaproteobacteria bacterium]